MVGRFAGWCLLAYGADAVKIHQDPANDGRGSLLGDRADAAAAQPRSCLATSVPEPFGDKAEANLPMWQLCPADYPSWQKQVSAAYAKQRKPASPAKGGKTAADEPDDEDVEEAGAFQWADYGSLEHYHDDEVTDDMDRGDEPNRVKLSKCPLFVQTTKNYATQQTERAANVEGIFGLSSKRFPIKAMEVVYWRHDWDATMKLFEKIRASMCFFIHYKCNASPNKGQIARWATMLMATAYQRANKLPCIILMEDDITPYADFEERLARFSIPTDTPRMLKFSLWGDGYVFNLPGVEEYHRRIYKYGATATIDWWINVNMQDISAMAPGLVKTQAVYSNGGDIYHADKVSKNMFNYTTATEDPAAFEPLLKAFRSKDDTDLAAALYRFIGEKPPAPLANLTA